MLLHVTFDEFAEAAKRVVGAKEAYVRADAGGVILTAAHPTENRLVTTHGHVSVEEAKKKLTAAGLTVHEGAWTIDGESILDEMDLSNVHVVAVSYLSGTNQPGVWVDAFENQPTTVQVLRALYDEFRSTGEMPEVSFEEFVRLANPNVAIVSPSELAGFVEAKQSGC